MVVYNDDVYDGDWTMVRTQIYLTREEREALASLARETGRTQSQLIRHAVDRLIRESTTSHRRSVLDEAAGMWRDRDDLAELQALRRSWDRT